MKRPEKTTAPDRQRFTLEERDPRSLIPNPLNWRRHPASQRAALAASVTEHGWLAAPLLNQRTGHLLDGHARVELALAEGDLSIPVHVVDVPLEQERRILRMLDPITGMAEEDRAALDDLIREIGDADLEALLGELAQPVFGVLPGMDPDAIPEQVETRCQAGDLWLMGEHRLLCGDCTDPANVERVIGGKERACVLLTDPPYAVDYVEKARDMHRRGYGHSRAKSGAAIQGDGIEAGQEASLWQSGIAAAYEAGVREDAAVYIWHAPGRAMLLLYNLLETMGFLHHQTLIWAKTNFVIGRCDYQWQHEPCFYGWKQGHRPPFYGKKNQTTVWVISRDTQHPDHPTQKPVAVFSPAVTNHTRPTEAVYDPFAGSGTTIIACEQTGRAARCIEIESRYVDVCLARWEQATGREAMRF